MRFHKILLSTCLLFTLFSCKKLIELPEEDLIAGDIALKTLADNESAVIGAYASTNIEMAILLNATFADEVKVAEFYNAGTTHEWQYGSTDVGIRDNYTAVTPTYRTINRVNRVLEALPLAEGTNDALRSRLRGEALFLRAFCHFQAWQYYCSPYDPDGLAMPYMEVSSIDAIARIKMGPFFEKLKADLAEAKNLLPDNLTDKFRATKLAATGLQARVAMYMEDWAGAIAYSTEYINAIPLSPRDEFEGLWKDQNSNETAFLLARTANVGGRIGSLFRATSGGTPASPTIGTITWKPSNEIWDAYDQINDIRFAAYFDNEPLLTSPRDPRVIAKYAGTPYATPDENVAHGKVFRTGEMYLIRAEARAKSGAYTGANSAESDINALRAARIDGYADVTFASADEAMDAIIQERYKELVYEGHRFFDLKRLGLPVERLDTDAPTANAKTLPAGNFRFLLPIPNSELQANPLMEQNPGYTQ